MQKIFDEWFSDEPSAKRAAKRVAKKGYITTVDLSISADGESGWLLVAYSV
ncbi:hypothetical protein [Undibacterium sp. TJN19]|uniref:hypothetical protein n=1 Tax=Undibacterium sp. TJN19 TaxID=3413055 RepID=UPI003BF2EBE1